MMTMPQPHIKLETVDEICFLSGNPDRVPLIASFLEKSQKLIEHRGLISYRGVSPRTKTPITILTTGMGCPSTAIVLEEAYRAGAKIFIRIGSTGSLKSGKDMGIGTIFIPHAAIRDEGTSIRFIPLSYPATANPLLYQSLLEAAKVLQLSPKKGIVLSTDIYYSNDPLDYKKWANFGAICVEMESSILFTFPATKSIDILTGSILTSDGNLPDNTNIYAGDKNTNIKKFNEGLNSAIKCAIESVDLLKEKKIL